MKEVLNICLSQSAGHLQSHFNNAQESFLDYNNTGKPQIVDPSIFLNPSVNRTNNTVSYSPRTILLDCSNGFGSLGKYEYVDNNEEELVGNVEKIQLQDRVAKSEYQKALDSNLKLPELNTTNTKYWTDYTRLIYDAKSFNEIHEWVYKDDKTVMRSDPSRVVKDFEIGVNLYKGINQDFMDECVRVFLEQCDNLNGVNFITEIDSSWGGISSEMLINLKDDFLPKTATTTWGLYDNKSNRELDNVSMMTRIKSTMSNLSNSSLFIPLNGKFKYKEIDETNLWQTSSVLSTVFEAVNLLYAQNGDDENSITMNEFINGITMGTKRNMVTDIDLKIDGEMIDLASLMFTKRQEDRHFFSNSVISRNVSKTNVGIFEKLINNGTSQRGLVEYDLRIPFKRCDTFPKIFKDEGYSVSLGTSNKMRVDFKEMRLFISKMIKGDERDWFIDEIEEYLTEYEFGWSDDEEYDD